MCTHPMVYHHLQTKHFSTHLYGLNKQFSLGVNYEDEKCSANQDLNPHPWLSRPVPLPLDHLHYFLFISSSYLRALLSGPGPDQSCIPSGSHLVCLEIEIFRLTGNVCW